MTGDKELFSRVVDIYHSTGESIRDTAKQMELSRTKVRKILITMGELKSDITDRALELLGKGNTQIEVAKIMKLSIATLSTYLPYGNRVYNRDEKTDTARRVEECRARQSRVAEKQLVRKPVEKNEKMEDSGMKEKSKVYKLHMELVGRDGAFDSEIMEVLKKYGKVNKSLSRTILVPGEMTLYSLHYAIQRCFGWQNSHLHHFTYEDNSFAGDTFGSWKPFCGQYFRFPYDTGSDMEDIYWNDDYEEGRSFNTWLKKKYTGPYSYSGELEQYVIAQGTCRAFAMENKELQLGPSFEEYLAGEKDAKTVAVDDAGLDKLGLYFECSMDELLERLTVEEVLGLDADIEEAKKNVINRYELFNSLYVAWYKTPDHLKDDFSRDNTEKVMPMADSILYEYDYGDGWRVKITCMEVYETGDEQIIMVGETLKPVGLEVDGRNVLDDVGGIYGYCEFLKSVYDKNFDSEESPGLYTDKESSLEWARGMGWNGRMNKPDKLL